MYRIIFFFVVLTISYSASLYAQNPELDSIVRLIAKSPEDTSKVNLYRQAGATILYENTDEALPYFKKGLALALTLKFNPGIERCYSATALAYSLNAKYDTSLLYIDSALPYAHKVGNKKRLALMYLNRADVYTNLENFSASLKDCDTAMKYAEESGNKDGMGRIYTIRSDVYEEQGQYALALEALEKAGHLFRESNNVQMTAMVYSERADIYTRTEEHEKAVPLYKQAIAIADSLTDVANLAAYTCGLAQAYAGLKQYREAEVMALKSRDYAAQTGNLKQQAVAYEVLSLIYDKLENYPKAIEYELKTYNILQQERDLVREQISSKHLSELYSKSGNSQKAYDYLKISSSLNDSIVKKRFNDETAKLQATFRVTEKDKEIELLNKNEELHRQKLRQQQLIALGGALIALLALGAVWLLMNRSKLKQSMKELELRNRIAADLHDEVGSSLSSIRMLSQMVAEKGDTDNSQKELLRKMSSNAQETVDKMSDIVWMIKPGENEGESLGQRMERFLYEMGSAANLETSFHMEGMESVKLSMQQRKDIYLIFKEAVNNAVKYSGATRVDVSVARSDKQLNLTVTDNGSGFDKEKIRRGNGLDNMKTRAGGLKAILTIDTADGKGTVIQLQMPVS